MLFSFKNLFLFLVLLVISLGFFVVVQAEWREGSLDATGQITSAANKAEMGDALDPQVIVTEIIKIALSVIGMIFIALIFMGGFWYINAQGDEEKIKKGTSIIRASVIGMLIVLSAYSIVYFVDKKFQRAAFIERTVTTATPYETESFYGIFDQQVPSQSAGDYIGR